MDIGFYSEGRLSLKENPKILDQRVISFTTYGKWLSGVQVLGVFVFDLISGFKMEGG